MFPRMRQRLGSALRDNLGLLIEFSTLGEYHLADHVTVAEPAARVPLPTGPTPRALRRAACEQTATERLAGLPAHRQRAGAPPPAEPPCVLRGR